MKFRIRDRFGLSSLIECPRDRLGRRAQSLSESPGHWRRLVLLHPRRQFNIMATPKAHRFAFLIPCMAVVLPACTHAESSSPTATPQQAPTIAEGADDAATPGTQANRRKPRSTTGAARNAGPEPKASVRRMVTEKPPRQPSDGDHPASGDDEVVHGLHGEVYSIAEISSLPNFSEASIGQVDVANLDFPSGNFPGIDGEGFALRFSGSFNIVEDREFQLCLNSADGSQLLLEDQLIVDNDGLHGPKEVCELVYLEAGEYELEVRYFKSGKNGAALQFLWGQGAGARVVVPTEVLFPPDLDGQGS